MNIVVVNGDSYKRPFRHLGNTDYTDVETADLIVFTGGEDVTPALYGAEPDPRTHNNPARDEREVDIYTRAIAANVPCVGICRGAQFLCVMNGGSLYQHINNHARYDTHKIVVNSLYSDVPFDYDVDVTSTHHQMMRPEGDHLLLGWAENIAFEDGSKEPEVVYWPNTKCLGVQFHPEYMHSDSSGYKYFQELLSHFILGEA